MRYERTPFEKSLIESVVTHSEQARHIDLSDRVRLILTSWVIMVTIGCGAKSASTPSAAAASGASTSAPEAGSSPQQTPAAPNPSSRPTAQQGIASRTHTTSNGSPASKPKAAPKPSDDQLAKWQIESGTAMRLLSCRDGFGDPLLQDMAVSPDGKQFVVAGGKLTVWSTASDSPTVDLLASLKQDAVERPLRAVAISPDGKYLAAGDQKGTLRIWNFADQTEVAAVKAHDGRLMQIAFSPNSEKIATTNYSGEVRLWQAADGKQIKSIKVSSREIVSLAFLSDTQLAAASNEVSVWNIESGQQESVMKTPSINSPAMGLSRNRGLLAFADSESRIQFWDVRKSALTEQALLGAGANLIEFSADGKRIATSSTTFGVRIWSPQGQLLQVLDADGGRTVAIRWLPTTNALLIASESGRVRLWGTVADAKALEVTPLELPTITSLAAGERKSMTSAQLQQVIDLRAFPRLPGAKPQWADFHMTGFATKFPQDEAELFYRYTLQSAGWTERGTDDPAQPGMNFQKDGCDLNVSISPAVPGTNAVDPLQVNLLFAGNYDTNWLPKFSPVKSPTDFNSFSFSMYRTKANLTEVEVGLLKSLHGIGWTASSRLNASEFEDPARRSLSLIQGGSTLIVSIGPPADAPNELVVQCNVTVTNKSLPIPADSGWIEFDNSTDLHMVANTKLDQAQTIEFYNKQMASEGWLAREAGRKVDEDRAWLPYIRGQQDLLIRLVARPEGGTRVIVGDAERSSWQLEKPQKTKPGDEQPGFQTADYVIPKGAQAIKFDVDQKQIQFDIASLTAPKLGDEFVKQLEALEWKRDGAGIVGDDYTFITMKQARSEIQLRARSDGKKTSAMISGDGLLWTKELPTAPARISYAIWLRRHKYDATLDRLDEFSKEMSSIPTGNTKK